MTRESDESRSRRVFKIYSTSSFSAPQVALEQLGSLRQTHSSALATTTRGEGRGKGGGGTGGGEGENNSLLEPRTEDGGGRRRRRKEHGLTIIKKRRLRLDRQSETTSYSHVSQVEVAKNSV